MLSDQEHLELYEERAAIYEYDGGLSRAEAEVAAYWAWRQLVGAGVVVPECIKEIVKRAKEVLLSRQ